MPPIIPHDKANHAIYGAVIFLAVLLVAHQLLPAYQIHIAAAAVVLMAVGKEVSDAVANILVTGNFKVGPHGVEALDAVATCVGGVLAALPLFIIKL